MTAVHFPEPSVVFEKGQGRSFVFVAEADDRANVLLDASLELLAAQARVVVIHTARIDAENWQRAADSFTALLQSKGIRLASFVALHAATALVINLSLHELKSVRTLTLIDATTRPHPGVRTRVIDWVENALPLGLPLRTQDRGFNALPFLHRLRCPVLILTTAHASQFERAEARILENGLPTAWYHELSDAAPTELADLISKFQQIPAKCPQRSRVAV
jgi:hypothetical protein